MRLASFKLGGPDTMRLVVLKHPMLVHRAAAPGLRVALSVSWRHAGGALKTLTMIEPTNTFRQMFQYSNSLAAAGGFISRRVAFPTRERQLSLLICG
jgi:hypothetical protein